MRKHEQELISALAEGTLDDASEAHALIESSEKLRAEYEAQKAAFDALRGAGTAKMTDQERATLRRDLWTELRTEPIGTPARTGRWYLRRPALVAAALVFVVGSAAVLNQQAAQQTADGVFSDVSSNLATGLESSEREALGDAAAGAADQITEDDMAEAPTTPTDTGLLDEMAHAIREGQPLTAYRSSLEAADPGEQSACLTAAGLTDHVVLGEIDTQEGLMLLVASPQEELEATTPISFVDPESCEVVYTAS